MRLLPVACLWCHKLIWPWQRMFRQLHVDPCWIAIERMREQDEVTGI